MRNIAKFYLLNQGIKAGHYIGQNDVRCYQPPPGYSAVAQLIDSCNGSRLKSVGLAFSGIFGSN